MKSSQARYSLLIYGIFCGRCQVLLQVLRYLHLQVSLCLRYGRGDIQLTIYLVYLGILCISILFYDSIWKIYLCLYKSIHFQWNTFEAKLKIFIGEELSIFAVATKKRIFNENKLKNKSLVSKRKRFWKGANKYF